ncbi:hypothetical protein BH23PSE2_BH23PSE2_10600 [soil metagenome]
MSIRLATCLLLFCACLPAAAREVRLSGANGDGGSCPDQVTTAVEDAQALRAGKPAPSATAREKPSSPRGAESDNAVRPPRWHSFLPGMFR